MTRNREARGDQMMRCRGATARVLENPGRPREHSAPCVISPALPGLWESEVLFRPGEQAKFEPLIRLEGPLHLVTPQQLASRRDRADLIERALQVEGAT